MRRFLLLLALLPTAAIADRLADDAVICLSENAMDQLIQAAARNDTRGMKYQFETKACRRITDNPEVSVLERGWNSKARIRMYGYDMQAWTLINYVE